MISTFLLNPVLFAYFCDEVCQPFAPRNAPFLISVDLHWITGFSDTSASTSVPPIRIWLRLYPPPVIVNPTTSLPSASLTENVFSLPFCSQPANISNVSLNLSLLVSVCACESSAFAVALTGTNTLPNLSRPVAYTWFPSADKSPALALKIFVAFSKSSLISSISVTLGAPSAISSDGVASIKNSAIFVILVSLVYLK